VRGHDFRRDIPVHEVTRARMRHIVEQRLAKRHTDDAASMAFAKAFGFASLDAQLTTAATLSLQAEQLVGLYVPEDRAIYVRPRTRGARVDPSDILHELAHALEDDTFGMAPLDASVGEDELLARRAVYEGDATAVAWGVQGVRAGRTASDAIADHRAEAGASTAVLGIPQEVDGSELGRASVLVRMELLFPYTAGSELVAEAFVAGGPALVDGLFRKLPVSTEQVLHAAKYFAGEAPVPVTAPAAPPGYAIVATGTMGELRTRALLELALPADRAITASEGWGGDAYTIVARAKPSGRAARLMSSGDPPFAVLWSMAWDDETGAARFAAALDEATRCSRGPCPLGAVTMRREGTHIAWTRGLVDPAPLAVLLRLPGAKPADAPPHGRVVLPSQQAGEVIVPAGGDPDVRAPVLGLRARLPPRFALVRLRHSELSVEDVRRHGRGVLMHDSKPFDPAAFPALAARIAAVLAGTAPIGKETISDVALPAGTGKEARWPLADGIGEMRFVALSICGGRKTLHITLAARGEEPRVALDQWVQSIEPIDAALPPICAAPEE
jgi:hypothetical protein